MIDWTKSMTQTYEFFTVDPTTWRIKEKLNTVTGAKIDRDLTSDTQVSGSIDYVGELDEKYVRIFLVAKQGNEEERIPLITMLCQTPSTSYNGKYTSTSITGYSPLQELKDKLPPFGYTITKNYPEWITENNKIQNQVEIDPITGQRTTVAIDRCPSRIDIIVSDICRLYMRAPSTPLTDNLYNDSLNNIYENIQAESNESWFDICKKLLEKVNYRFRVDELGTTYFEKIVPFAQLAPVYTYTTDNSSILSSDVSIDRDLYGIPNVVEVIVTSASGSTISARVENRDESSITSIPSRGREVMYRVVNPERVGVFTSDLEGQEALEELAWQILEKMSLIDYTITYTHGFCNTNIGDSVYIDYPEAGLNHVKAYITKQSIDCKTGCTVSETAVYNKQLFKRS